MSTSTGPSDDIVCGGKDEVDGRDDVDVHQVLETSGIFSLLVPEIFLSIMSRLPLKSLSQCKWVCKSWFKLIRSSSFAKVQYEWAIKNNSPWVFFWSFNKSLYLVDDQVFHHLQTSATALNLELKEFAQVWQCSMFHAVGCVNGLVCVTSDHKYIESTPFYIFNPITREHVVIPKSPKSSTYHGYDISAFGFDPTTDSYKVVRLLQYEDGEGEYMSLKAEVYTLGSSKWRKIKDVPDIIPRGSGLLLNGNLHWLSIVFDSLAITAFSVGDEKFNIIQAPAMLKTHDYSLHLRVVEERLCVLRRFSHDEPLEIWMMDDYGVQSSWVKKYSLYSNSSGPTTPGLNSLIKLKNDEFLLQFEEFEDEFMGYLDPKKDTLRPIRIERCRKEHFFRAVMQVGSLFSPKDVGTLRREKKVHSRRQRNFYLLKKQKQKSKVRILSIKFRKQL